MSSKTAFMYFSTISYTSGIIKIFKITLTITVRVYLLIIFIFVFNQALETLIKQFNIKNTQIVKNLVEQLQKSPKWKV